MPGECVIALFAYFVTTTCFKWVEFYLVCVFNIVHCSLLAQSPFPDLTLMRMDGIPYYHDVIMA
jgi:hypothetical protein